jgi:hypothetical protein
MKIITKKVNNIIIKVNYEKIRIKLYIFLIKIFIENMLLGNKTKRIGMIKIDKVQEREKQSLNNEDNYNENDNFIEEKKENICVSISPNMNTNISKEEKDYDQGEKKILNSNSN